MGFAARAAANALGGATGAANDFGNSLGNVAPGGQGATFATGGLVSGPTGRDRVPAWLTAGEFVVNAAATRANLAQLVRWNGGLGTGGPGFAAGGLVPSGPQASLAGLTPAQFASFFQSIAKTIETLVGDALKAGFQAKTVDEGLVAFQQKLADAILDAVIVAFAQSSVIQGAINPMIAAITAATAQGLTGTNFQAAMAQPMADFLARIQALTPAFKGTYEIVRQMRVAMTGTSAESAAVLAYWQNIATVMPNVEAFLQQQNAQLGIFNNLMNDNVITLDELETLFAGAVAKGADLTAIMEQFLVVMGLTVQEAHDLVEQLQAGAAIQLPGWIPPAPTPVATPTPTPTGPSGPSDIDVAIAALLQLSATIRGLVAPTTALEQVLGALKAETALYATQIDLLRQSLASGTLTTQESITALEAIVTATQARYQLELDLVKALKDEVDRLTAAVDAGLDALGQLNLAFAVTDARLGQMFLGLVQLYGLVGDVTTRVTIWLLALQTVSAAIDRFAQGLGAIDFTAIQTAIQAVFAQIPILIQQIVAAFPDDPESQLAAFQSMAAGLQGAMQSALSAASTYFQRLAAEATKASQARVTALQAQRTTLQAQLQAAQDWEAVAKSVKQLLLDLQTGSLSPTNPMTQVGVAQAAFDAAMAQFRAAPTPALAAQVQTLAQTLLQAGSAVFARPSPQYQALFNSVTAALDEVLALAGPLATDTQQLLAAIAAVDAAIVAEQAALTATLTALAAQEQAALQAIKDTFAAQFDVLRAAMLQALANLYAQQQAAKEALTAIIGEGNTYQNFIAQMAKQQTTLLQGIYGELAVLLRSLGVAGFAQQGIIPGPLGAPRMILAHGGEAITGPARASRPSGAVTLTLAPGAIVVQGVRDPQAAARAAVRELERSLQSGGRLRAIVQQATR